MKRLQELFVGTTGREFFVNYLSIADNREVVMCCVRSGRGMK